MTYFIGLRCIAQRLLGPLLFFVVAASVAYVTIQPRLLFGNAKAYDAASYVEMAHQFRGRLPISTGKPFVYRIGLPWLAARLPSEDVLTNFEVLDVVFGSASLIFLYALLRAVSISRESSLFFCLCLVMNPLGPMRLAAFYPALTDTAAMFFVTLIMLLALRWAIDGRRRSWCHTSCLAILCFVGTLFRESVLAVPLALWLAECTWTRRERSWIFWPEKMFTLSSTLPLIAGLSGIVFTHELVVPVRDFAFGDSALAALKHNLTNPTLLLLLPFTTFGAVVCLFVVKPNASRLADKGVRPYLMIYFLIIAALTLIGGSHVDRFLFWSFPSVFALLGKRLDILVMSDQSVLRKIALAAILMGQLLGFRALGSIPNADYDALIHPGDPQLMFLAPYGDHTNFAQIWASFMSEHSRHILLAEWVGFFMLIQAFVCLGQVDPRPVSRGDREEAADV